MGVRKVNKVKPVFRGFIESISGMGCPFDSQEQRTEVPASLHGDLFITKILSHSAQNTADALFTALANPVRLIMFPQFAQKGENLVKTLIVEDSAIFRQLFKETLRSRFPSMEVLEAASGEEAFQKIEAFSPDITFMDIELPGENGLELTQKIKDLYPDITVIILTGYDWPEYREAAYPYTDYFLSKGSSTRKEILKLVESIFSKKGKRKVHRS